VGRKEEELNFILEIYNMEGDRSRGEGGCEKGKEGEIGRRVNRRERRSLVRFMGGEGEIRE
jgi:hypothetical protein